MPGHLGSLALPIALVEPDILLSDPFSLLLKMPRPQFLSLVFFLVEFDVRLRLAGRVWLAQLVPIAVALCTASNRLYLSLQSNLSYFAWSVGVAP